MVFYVLLAMNPAFAASDDDIDGLRSSLGREWILTKNDRLRNIKTYVRLEDGKQFRSFKVEAVLHACLLYTSPSPRDGLLSRMPSSA